MFYSLKIVYTGMQLKDTCCMNIYQPPPPKKSKTTSNKNSRLVKYHSDFLGQFRFYKTKGTSSIFIYSFCFSIKGSIVVFCFLFRLKNDFQCFNGNELLHGIFNYMITRPDNLTCLRLFDYI